MEFNENKPIYLQIFDAICERILSGDNPNTVMRTYEKLTADGIIFNKRGIGYFVSADAKERIQDAQRKIFLEEELPLILRKMELLGIDPAVLNQKKS